MFKKPRGGFASDDGMSVLEVVIAAFILFFVLTSVFGLVVTSTKMGINAKERNALTSALTSHLEWIRSLSYDQIAITGGTEPDAAIQSPRPPLSVEGFTVVITTTVTEKTGYKEVNATAVATKAGYPTVTMSQEAFVRDYRTSMTMTNTSPLTISFKSSTPAQNSVVYSQYVVGGTPLDIGIDVESADPEVPIVYVRMYCDGQLLRDGSHVHADVAEWTPESDTFSQTFTWNTLQVDNEGDPGAIGDGSRTVYIEAEDQDGNRVVKERTFLVDNYDPGPPSNVRVTAESDVLARIVWTPGVDGNVDAWGYGLKLSQVNSAGNLILLNSLDPDGNPDDIRNTSTAYNQTTAGFSRYQAEVRSLSPRLNKSAYVMAVGPDALRPYIYVSKPKLSGTSRTVYSGKNAARAAATTVNIAVQTPTFGCSSIRYDLYRDMSVATLAAGTGTAYRTNIAATFTETITKTVGKFGTPDPYYYRYKITYTPTGTTANGEEVIWSNIVGPVTSADNVLTEMPFVQW